MSSLRVEYLICAKDATGAMLVLRKLWLILGRELPRLGTKGSGRAGPVRLNFVVRPRMASGEELAVQVRGLGLEQPGR
jgi:hypothetical protein